MEAIDRASVWMRPYHPVHWVEILPSIAARADPEGILQIQMKYARRKIDK